MAYFGPNDMGYHPDRHNLLSYNADGTSVVGRNPSNMWTSDGYDFSCMNVTPYTQNQRDGYEHHLYGSADPQGMRPQSPRIIMVTRQWGIATTHYRKQYHKCPQHPNSPWRWDGEPGSENHERWKYQFIDSVGNKEDRWIENQFLMSCNNSGGGDCGGNCGCYNDICGENPYYGTDVDKICASHGNDYVLVKLSEPLPNSFIPAKIASKEFIIANMHGSDSDIKDIKKQRHCLLVDQFNRVGIRNYSTVSTHPERNVLINGGNYDNVVMECGPKTSVVLNATNLTSHSGFPRSSDGDLCPECANGHGWGEPEGIDVGWSRINRTYGGQYPEPWDGDQQEDQIYITLEMISVRYSMEIPVVLRFLL